MKKIEYSKPEIEVRSLNIESYILDISSNVGVSGDEIDDGTHDGDAKGFWDDEEDY